MSVAVGGVNSKKRKCSALEEVKVKVKVEFKASDLADAGISGPLLRRESDGPVFCQHLDGALLQVVGEAGEGILCSLPLQIRDYAELQEVEILEDRKWVDFDVGTFPSQIRYQLQRHQPNQCRLSIQRHNDTVVGKKKRVVFRPHRGGQAVTVVIAENRTESEWVSVPSGKMDVLHMDLVNPGDAQIENYNLFLTQTLVDMTLRLDGGDVRIHRLPFVAASSVAKTMLTVGQTHFKKDDGPEGPVVCLPGVNMGAALWFVRYLYLRCMPAFTQTDWRTLRALVALFDQFGMEAEKKVLIPMLGMNVATDSFVHAFDFRNEHRHPAFDTLLRKFIAAQPLDLLNSLREPPTPEPDTPTTTTSAPPPNSDTPTTTPTTTRPATEPSETKADVTPSTTALISSTFKV